MSEEQVDRRIEGTPRVRVTRRLMPHVEQRMGELFDVTLNRDDSPLDRDALAAAVRECDVLVPTVTDRIDADLIESAGEDLRLIANFGAGVEHIDLAAARKRGIMVTNTPGVFTDDTADLTMGLIIGVPRRMREGVELVRSGEWTGWAPCSMLGFGLRGKCLAIVGMGRIGQAVAHRARAFGLEIAYHNRKRIPEALENMLGATYVDNLDDLMRCADILSLHAPGGEETHHLIDARRIGLMKPGSCLINTACGDLVDQDALIEALEDGRLGGAGLDVYPEEPKVDPRLLKVPNVLTLPHLASATVEGREASGEKVIANIRIWADGHRPPDQVLEGWV